MNNTDTLTASELRELIATNRKQTQRADRMGLRDFARNCRINRRELEAKLAAVVSA